MMLTSFQSFTFSYDVVSNLKFITLMSSEGPEVIGATYGGHAALHYKERLIAVSVAVLGTKDLFVLHYARNLQEP